jgi:glycosyltransferase involved in cell wall biosynthesis
MTPSSTHLVLIPTYNSGPRLLTTVRDALERWSPVWVVVDGSTDGSHLPVLELALTEPGLRVLPRNINRGKGAVVLDGAEAARVAGFTHALVMDADGQHPADRIAEFMMISQNQPAALIAGRPVFGADAPWVRLNGRKLSIGMAHLETLGRVIDDPLFGFRVYPLGSLVEGMRRTRYARRYDFDPEIAVRMAWAGTPVINVPAVCRYFSEAEGGVSHFRYLRDNVRMVWLHVRLLLQWFWRGPAMLLARRRTAQR